ncbi:MAG: hypothetical protein HY316_05670 [Acidobacteria bacterium]|nr:hypothetical protein [Acidobacteriota bacterium]
MSSTVRLLITGKRDKLWKAVGAAFSRRPGVRALVMPVGSAIIETVRSAPLDAVLYTLSSKEEIELLRWIVQINPSIALIALVPAADAALRKQVLEEGVAQVVAVSSLDPVQIRKSIVGPQLRKLGLTDASSNVLRQISNDLHAIRSALTAILGSAEMALKHALPPAKTRKQIKEIPRGVMEIENILRRLDRRIKSRRPAAKSRH